MEQATKPERAVLRRVYFETWQALKRGAPLEPLRHLVATVIERHPEYHEILDEPGRMATVEFDSGASAGNPFLHMGMHVALLEQVEADQPRGVRELYHTLRNRLGDVHGAEHLMMRILEQTLAEAHQTGAIPDHRLYLHRLRQVVKHG